jgi:D-beta-D-heptose 7-phosphate kinase / D-beta-D-heptose 1-phosphate adenosyltransferase
MNETQATGTLSNLITRFQEKHLLVIGDLMLDRFIYGSVERISPEAPIPVLRIQRETATLGGAGNVVRNLAALGAQVDVIGITGDDSAAFDLAQLFAELPNVTPMILKDASRPTTLKVRCIGGSQQLLRADRESSTPIDHAQEKQLLERIHATLPTAEAIILSDYAKGVLTEHMIAAILKLAQKRPVIVDPKGRDFSRYRGTFMITPNRKELTEATGVTAIKTIAEAEQAARVLITAYDINTVMAKLGADGVCLVTREQPALHIKGTAREVFDVSGAGDTVVAIMALALAAGSGLENAARLANLGGSIVVGKVGTATVTSNDLLEGLEQSRQNGGHDKLMDWQKAGEQCEKWRAQGLKIGFTNGCFDILHPGHIALLRQARARCDRLILGLNTDASVKRLKGPLRPVNNETSRAAVLGALSDIDGIVLFDQDTPLELIRHLRPHLLVKGEDYTPETVVGWDLVKSWGGELLLATLVKDQSTTKIIARAGGSSAA